MAMRILLETSGCLRRRTISAGAETVPENGLPIMERTRSTNTNGWNGSSWTTVQGNAMPRINYEASE